MAVPTTTASTRWLLRDALGTRFIAGVALSTGPRSYNHEGRLYVMPIDRLCTPVS